MAQTKSSKFTERYTLPSQEKDYVPQGVMDAILSQANVFNSRQMSIGKIGELTVTKFP